MADKSEREFLEVWWGFLTQSRIYAEYLDLCEWISRNHPSLVVSGNTSEDEADRLLAGLMLVLQGFPPPPIPSDKETLLFVLESLPAVPDSFKIVLGQQPRWPVCFPLVRAMRGCDPKPTLGKWLDFHHRAKAYHRNNPAVKDGVVAMEAAFDRSVKVLFADLEKHENARRTAISPKRDRRISQADLGALKALLGEMQARPVRVLLEVNVTHPGGVEAMLKACRSRIEARRRSCVVKGLGNTTIQGNPLARKRIKELRRYLTVYSLKVGRGLTMPDVFREMNVPRRKKPAPWTDESTAIRVLWRDLAMAKRIIRNLETGRYFPSL